jgi:hypothetical protein
MFIVTKEAKTLFCFIFFTRSGHTSYSSTVAVSIQKIFIDRKTRNSALSFLEYGMTGKPVKDNFNIHPQTIVGLQDCCRACRVSEGMVGFRRCRSPSFHKTAQ